MQATGNNPNELYHLSIRLHADGFSFYGYSLDGIETVDIEEYAYSQNEPIEETLKRALEQSKLIAKNKQGFAFCLVCGPCIQVPLEEFRKEDAGHFLKLTYSGGTNGKTYYNILPHLEIAQIFTVSSNLEMVLRHYLPNIRLYHTQTMMLEKMSLINNYNAQRVYVYFHEKEMFVFGYKEQKLCFSNSFPADQTDNATYFILSVCKDLGISSEQGECIFLGENHIKKEVVKQTRSHLPCIKDVKASDIFRRPSLARNPKIPFDVLVLLAQF